MHTILALAALGPWSYAGFLEQPNARPNPAPTSSPDSARPAPAPAPTPAPDPVVPEAPVAAPVVQAEARKAPAAPSRMPPPVAPAPAPTRYRLADASGQLWEHADADALRSFVEDRNRSFASVPTYSFTMPAGSRCAGGRCR